MTFGFIIRWLIFRSSDIANQNNFAILIHCSSVASKILHDFDEYIYLFGTEIDGMYLYFWNIKITLTIFHWCKWLLFFFVLNVTLSHLTYWLITYWLIIASVEALILKKIFLHAVCVTLLTLKQYFNFDLAYIWM